MHSQTPTSLLYDIKAAYVEHFRKLEDYENGPADLVIT